jgi:hypothetical protein
MPGRCIRFQSPPALIRDLGFFTKLLRFTDYKRMTPFDVQLRTPAGVPVLAVKHGVSFILSRVVVLDEHGSEIGFFKQKFFSIGGTFDMVLKE